MPLHAKESDYQIERDGDMIVRYVTTGVFRDFEQARGYISAVYAPDANVSRGGIARALARLEKHYSGPHGSGIHDCRTKGHEDPDNSGRCIHCGKSENQEGYHFRRERMQYNHSKDAPMTEKQEVILSSKKYGDFDLDVLVDRLCHPHSPKPSEIDLYNAQVAILRLAETIRSARSQEATDVNDRIIRLVEKHREAAENANWKSFDESSVHVHDWRTYITEDVRASWDALPLEAKCAIIDCCQDVADREEWD